MQFSHAKHFWTWFSYNSEVYRHLKKMEKKQEQFWEQELITHMRAYTKKLSVALLLPEEGDCSIIITAKANRRYFRMAEAMAAKAPPIPNWKVFGLQPPGLYSAHLEKQYAATGITRAGIKCLPPMWKPSANKYAIQCYAAIGEEPDERTVDAVDAMVCDQLGEKVIGLQVCWVEVYDVTEIPYDQYSQLITLEELSAYFPEKEVSNLSINCLGELRKNR